MREESAGSPERTRDDNEEPAVAVSWPRAGSGSRTRDSAISAGAAERADGNVRGSMTRSNVDGGTGGAVGAADAGAPVRTPLWRPRPPRRPRRLRRWSGPVSEVCAAAATAAGGCSKMDSCSPSFISCSVSLGCSSENSAMIGSNRVTGSPVVSLTATPAIAAGATGIGAPRRTSPSSAFSFHCGRRKRSAAVVNQRTASEVVPAFS